MGISEGIWGCIGFRVIMLYMGNGKTMGMTIFFRVYGPRI